ncbi:conserved hypothetical protein [Leishmania infantum JPCM5]|uniref:Aminotransferase_class_IV_-_putative n=4 Tax=Leishmania donovani species complex TaxID=38574 RepID=A0A6L0XZS1_LEIIN|nr:conserved hypothetical protein [Leishmania infantum JPCM5]CAC9539071.1 Aminotransferase_class_IV_-_putative [Leishmania infantum]CAM71654.1 conserved hypothetical protein [Leishmania infantum JPCM5]SUZ45602.1 Aminotransferase_class_IV_-_putative [Leishmania infantum]VDZ48418.1 Aminotransferase_class_IV_putative/Pfam:PF01063 [Leishmania donovani]|eukprot:XP_001468568.1 conserved hypothetical protein [Leishmania infantum JPCM5]
MKCAYLSLLAGVSSLDKWTDTSLQRTRTKNTMERIPLVVRRMVATEQNCAFVHFFASFADVSATPLAIETKAFRSAAAGGAADDAEPAYQLVYDVMRSRNGHILFKKSYAERFTHSLTLAAPALALPAELQSLVQSRLQAYIESPGVYLDGVTEKNVKLLSWIPATGASTKQAEAFPIPVIIMLAKSSYPSESMYREGAKLGLLFNAHRINPNAKVAQMGLRDRANAYLTENGVYEVLLVHDAADAYLVPEGSRSNYLLQKSDGTWWCSAEEDILVGITLKTTYRVVQACGLGSVQHAKLTLKDILESKLLFILGTSPTIMPVQSVLLYGDSETRRFYEEAVRALGATAGTVQQVSDAKAELLFPVNVELAAALRTQYFAEAASS